MRPNSWSIWNGGGAIIILFGAMKVWQWSWSHPFSEKGISSLKDIGDGRQQQLHRAEAQRRCRCSGWTKGQALDGKGVIELSLTMIEGVARGKMRIDRFSVGFGAAAGGYTQKHAKQRVFQLYITDKGGTEYRYRMYNIYVYPIPITRPHA
jgi:hypothetical protein